MTGLPGWWLEDSAVSRLLAPLGLVFRGLTWLRREAYQRGWLKCHRLGVPVIVVGNIFVGGTGKTPLVAALVQRLTARGWHPGVICRGYGGDAVEWPQRVTASTSARAVGDEPVLLARRTGRPVMAGPDRVAAGRTLLAEASCDILVLDDGLQHYRLARDVEIVVMDGERGAGNGRCLPAGPLREPVSRLDTVDLVVVNGEAEPHAPAFTLQGDRLVAVDGSGRQQPLEALAGRPVDAVAGIGNPQRFFSRLSDAGLELTTHAFADHHAFLSRELRFDGPEKPVVMTEKDAVKCQGFAGGDWWYLTVSAQLNDAAERALESVLVRLDEAREGRRA